MDVAGGGKPANKRQKSGDMDHRRVQAGGTVGDTAVGRAALLGRLHHSHHLAEKRIVCRRDGDDGQRPCQIQRARPQHGSDRRRQRCGFSGDQRNVQIGSPFGHRCVYRYALAGSQYDRHSGLDLAHWKIDLRAVGLHHERATRREPHQSVNRKPGSFAHHVVERAPDQKEKQQ